MDTIDLLTVTEVGEQLGMSKYQVYRRIVRGDLHAIRSRAGNVHYLIPRMAVDEYIAAGGAGVLSPPLVGGVQMMRPSEVAAITGYSVETVRKMCREGRIACMKGSGDHGHYRVPREEIEHLRAFKPR